MRFRASSSSSSSVWVACETSTVTVTRCADARGAVDGDPRVAAVGRRRLAGVDAHPHVDRGLSGHGWFARALALDGGQDCVARAREGDEEGVALSVDFVAAMVGKCLAHEPLVRYEHFVVPVAELLDQRGRTLDVREVTAPCGRSAMAATLHSVV